MVRQGYESLLWKLTTPTDQSVGFCDLLGSWEPDEDFLKPI